MTIVGVSRAPYKSIMHNSGIVILYQVNSLAAAWYNTKIERFRMANHTSGIPDLWEYLFAITPSRWPDVECSQNTGHDDEKRGVGRPHSRTDSSSETEIVLYRVEFSVEPAFWVE